MSMLLSAMPDTCAIAPNIQCERFEFCREYTLPLSNYVQVYDTAGCAGIYSIDADKVVIPTKYKSVTELQQGYFTATENAVNLPFSPTHLVDSTGAELYESGMSNGFDQFINDRIVISVSPANCFSFFDIITKEQIHYNNIHFEYDNLRFFRETNKFASDYFEFVDINTEKHGVVYIAGTNVVHKVGNKSVNDRDTAKFPDLNALYPVVIPPLYDDIKLPSEGLCAVLKNTKNGKRWGFIDMKGQLVIPYRYHDATAFYCGFACVKDKDGHWMFIDKTGNMAYPYKLPWPATFRNGICIYKDADGTFCILKSNEKFRNSLPGWYANVEMRDTALIRVLTSDNRVLYYNKNLKEVAPRKKIFQNMMSMDDSEGIVVYNSLRECEYYVPTQESPRSRTEGYTTYRYAKGSSFKNGLARVLVRGKGWGIINKQFKEILPCQYDYIYGYSKKSKIALVLDKGVCKRIKINAIY